MTVLNTDDRTVPHDCLTPAEQAVNLTTLYVDLDVIQLVQLTELVVDRVDAYPDFFGWLGGVTAPPKAGHAVTEGKVIECLLAGGAPQRNFPNLHIWPIGK